MRGDMKIIKTANFDAMLTPEQQKHIQKTMKEECFSRQTGQWNVSNGVLFCDFTSGHNLVRVTIQNGIAIVTRPINENQEMMRFPIDPSKPEAKP